MLRYAVPLLALLACAGCGNGSTRATKPAPTPTPAPAPVAVVQAPKPAPVPAPAKPKKLKKGEVEVVVSQPPARELPADFGLDTTPEQLAAHAHICAREEVAAGLAGQATLAQRQDFLIAAWTPVLHERQQREAGIRTERDQKAAKLAANAAKQGEQEAKLQALEVDYAHRLEVERLRTAPVGEK